MKISLTQSLYSFFIICLFNLSLSAQINTPNGATIPFGSNIDYPGSDILPTNLPNTGTYGASQDAADAYNQWKSDYVESCGGTPEQIRVKFDSPSETVSEGIAYGMLLAAYAADQALLDGLWSYYKANMNGNGVMNWKIGGCSGTIGSGGATDAELDAAMALIIANHQWPETTNPHNYSDDATSLITSIKDHEIQPITSNGPYQTNNGDQWGFGNDCRNPSYQAPAYYKMYAQHVPSQSAFWNNAVIASYDLLNSNAHPITGLVSNWSNHNGVANSCNGPNEYGWDACRNPWRMGTDVAWFSDPDAKAICNKIAGYTQGIGATNIKGPMNQDGTNGSYHSPTFIGTLGVGVMGSNSSYQTLLNSIYTETVAVTDPLPYYFGNTLRLISLFNLTGNFWAPSLNSAPSAQIIASSISGLGPLSVSFDASNSSDPENDNLSYLWNFGNGNTSTNITSNQTYILPGVYTVSLTVDDGNGNTDTETISITVIDPNPTPPHAIFTADIVSGDYPLTVNFDGSSSYDVNADPLIYDWDFGDGNNSSGVNSAHTFTNPGIYPVVLTVSDGTFSDTYTLNIEAIDSPPIAIFTANPTVGSPTLTVAVDGSSSIDPNGSPLLYSWDFGDGTTVSNVTSYSHEYDTEGVYIITLTVEDENGNTNTTSESINVSNSICNIQMRYRTSDNDNNSANDNQVRPEFELENTGTESINLSDITFRYWFKTEGIQSQNIWIDYADAGSSNITSQVVAMANPVDDADYYIEFGFTSASGILTPGSKTKVNTRFAKTDWSNHNETNDYSFNMALNSLSLWENITVYCNSSLSYGNEPISDIICEMPFNINVNLGFDPNRVNVSWDPIPNAILYQIRYRRALTSSWSFLSTTSLSRSIQVLIQNKIYDFRIRAKCDGDVWSDLTPIDKFRTVQCKSPTNLSTIQLNNNKVRLEWDHYNYADKYQIFFREAGSTDNWSKMVTYYQGMNFRVLNNLIPGKTYEYKVRSWCEVSYGPFSSVNTFTNNLLKEVITNSNDFIISPNPVESNLNISIKDEDSIQADINIYTVNGILIYSQKIRTLIENSNLNIDVSFLEKGIYIIQYKNDSNQLMDKFIKI